MAKILTEEFDMTKVDQFYYEFAKNCMDNRDKALDTLENLHVIAPSDWLEVATKLLSIPGSVHNLIDHEKYNDKFPDSRYCKVLMDVIRQANPDQKSRILSTNDTFYTLGLYGQKFDELAKIVHEFPEVSLKDRVMVSKMAFHSYVRLAKPREAVEILDSLSKDAKLEIFSSRDFGDSLLELSPDKECYADALSILQNAGFNDEERKRIMLAGIDSLNGNRWISDILKTCINSDPARPEPIPDNEQTRQPG